MWGRGTRPGSVLDSVLDRVLPAATLVPQALGWHWARTRQVPPAWGTRGSSRGRSAFLSLPTPFACTHAEGASCVPGGDAPPCFGPRDRTRVQRWACSHCSSCCVGLAGGVRSSRVRLSRLQRVAPGGSGLGGGRARGTGQTAAPAGFAMR